jgi:mRNA-degrading endonuclease RelE of RelBE toxin-antitoxin system
MKRNKSLNYRVEWTKIAKKKLDKLDKFTREQILRFFKKENLLFAPNKIGKRDKIYNN